MSTFVISSAGNLESSLKACGEPCGSFEYPTLEAARSALGCFVLGTHLYKVDGACWLVYRSKEECNADLDGSYAFARIEARS